MNAEASAVLAAAVQAARSPKSCVMIVSLARAPGRAMSVARKRRPSGMAITTHELLDLWMERSNGLVLNGDGSPLAPSTLASYRAATKNLRAHLPDIDASALKPLDLQKAIATIRQERGPGAAKAAFLLFGMAWKYAIAVEEMPPKRCPTILMRAPKVRRRREDWMPLATVQAIYVEAGKLAATDHFVAGSAIQLAQQTGLRVRSDLLPLRIGQVDYKERLVRLHIQKSGHAETLPVSTDALRIFQALEDASVGGWLFPGQGARGHLHNIYRQWNRVLDAVAALGHQVTDAHGKRFVPHHCRHARIAHCLAAGESPLLVGRGVGQSDPNSVNHYAATRMESLRQPAETFAALVRHPKTTPPMGKPETTTGNEEQAFGARLRAAAESIGMDVRTLAEFADVTPESVRNWFAGRSMPPATKLAGIARRLRVSTDYLLGVRP